MSLSDPYSESAQRLRMLTRGNCQFSGVGLGSGDTGYNNNIVRWRFMVIVLLSCSRTVSGLLVVVPV